MNLQFQNIPWTQYPLFIHVICKCILFRTYFRIPWTIPDVRRERDTDCATDLRYSVLNDTHIYCRLCLPQVSYCNGVTIEQILGTRIIMDTIICVIRGGL